MNELNTDPAKLEKKLLGLNRIERFSILFGLDFNEEVEQVEENIPERFEIQPNFPLFPHQSDALYKCKQILEEKDNARVMLHMPTGSGKTRTAMHLVARHLNNRRAGVVLWLASSQELCEQGAEAFAKAWSNLGERTIPLIRFWGSKGKWPNDLVDCMLVAGLGKLWSAWNNWDPGEKVKRANNVSLIIFDEAHQSTAPTYRKMIEELLRRNPEN